MDTQQIIGYLITGLWTLVNIGVCVAIVAFLIRLYKYLGKSEKPKEAGSTSSSTAPNHR